MEPPVLPIAGTWGDFPQTRSTGHQRAAELAMKQNASTKTIRCCGDAEKMTDVRGSHDDRILEYFSGGGTKTRLAPLRPRKKNPEHSIRQQQS